MNLSDIIPTAQANLLSFAEGKIYICLPGSEEDVVDRPVDFTGRW